MRRGVSDTGHAFAPLHKSPFPLDAGEAIVVRADEDRLNPLQSCLLHHSKVAAHRGPILPVKPDLGIGAQVTRARDIARRISPHRPAQKGAEAPLPGADRRLIGAGHEYVRISKHRVDLIKVAMIYRIAVGMKQVQQCEMVFCTAHHQATRTSTPQVRGSA